MAEAKKQKALAKKPSTQRVAEAPQSSSQPATVTAGNVEAASGKLQLNCIHNHNQWHLCGGQTRPCPFQEFLRVPSLASHLLRAKLERYGGCIE